MQATRNACKQEGISPMVNMCFSETTVLRSTLAAKCSGNYLRLVNDLKMATASNEEKVYQVTFVGKQSSL